MRYTAMAVTFALAGCFTAMGGEEIIPANRITTAYLSVLLKSVGYTVSPPDNDGDIKIEKEDGRFMFVRSSDNYVRILDIWHIKDDVSELRKLRFVNEYNTKWIYKAFIDKSGKIIVAPNLLCEEGLTDKQMVAFVNAYYSAAFKIMADLNKDHEILK